MKKLLSLLAILALFAFTGCFGGDDDITLDPTDELYGSGDEITDDTDGTEVIPDEPEVFEEPDALPTGEVPTTLAPGFELETLEETLGEETAE